MSPFSAGQFPQEPRQQSAPGLLAELQAAHSTLLERIKELGEITAHAVPSRLEYTSARLRLSQASIARRSVLNRTLEYLGARVDAAGSQVLARVRAADGELIAHSVEHLGKWTAEAVGSDWAGYCDASRSMRDHMARTVNAEAELLQPLLSPRD